MDGRMEEGADFQVLTAVLLAAVGPTVVQAMAGTSDRDATRLFAAHDGPAPDPVMERRVRLGYQVWRTVEMSEGRDVALAFLLGANPRLGHDLPVNAIYDLRAQDVLGAAVAFVQDVYGP